MTDDPNDDNALDPEEITAAAAEAPVTNPQDRAFLDAIPDQYLGATLHPFSMHRQLAAQALGNRILCGRVSTVDDSGFYDGLYIDVIALMYLCSSPVSESITATRRPERIIERAMNWAEQKKIHLGSDAWTDALVIYWLQIDAVNRSAFAVRSAKGSDPHSSASGND